MAVNKLMNTGGLAALAAGLALIALPASAGAQERGQWRGGGDGSASVQRGGGGGGGNWGGNRGGGDRGNGRGSPQSSSPQTNAPQPSAPQPTANPPQVRGNWRGGVDRSAPSLRQDQVRQNPQGRPQRWSGQNGGNPVNANPGNANPGGDRGRPPAWSGSDRNRDGRDGRWDGNRNRPDNVRNDNDRRGNDRWRDNNNVRRDNDRWRNDGSNLAPYEQTDDAPFLSADLVPTEGMNLDDKEEALIGEVIPAAAAFLGLAFIACTLVIAGLPPLPGFVGKFAMVHALLNPLGLGASSGFQLGAAGWTLVALLVASGLLALVALTRAGIRHFWAAHDRSAPKLLVLEGLPIALLLGACAALAWQAGAVMRYTQATADALHAPAGYMRAVMTAEPVPNPPQPATTPGGNLP